MTYWLSPALPLALVEIWHSVPLSTSKDQTGADNGLSGTSADLMQTMACVAWIPVTCDLTGNCGIGLPFFMAYTKCPICLEMFIMVRFISN